MFVLQFGDDVPYIECSSLHGKNPENIEKMYEHIVRTFNTFIHNAQMYHRLSAKIILLNM